jgi:pantetheine-phosphate adenylyltransferase
MNQPPAIYPGVFDPLTLGHLDIIDRGRGIFGRVIVAVADNPGKQALWPRPRRVDLVRQATASMDGVEVMSYDGLTVDFVRRQGGLVILRGVRTMSDFDYESHLALTNRAISGVETVLLPASSELGFISSTLIRQVARNGGDVSAMVPPCVAEALAREFPPGQRTE